MALAYRTMIVSPRNNWRISIVAGLRVATVRLMSLNDFLLAQIALTRVVI